MACMTLTHNNYRLTFTLAAIPSVFAIFMLLYYVSTPNRLQTKHYGMPKYPARPAPSKKRHGRGPLAMVYEPVPGALGVQGQVPRPRVHPGKRTWRRVGEWLAEHLDEMKRRAQRFKEKRPGEKLFPQLRRQEGEPEEDWQTRQREWEAEYLSAEAELKYRGFRRGFQSADERQLPAHRRRQSGRIGHRQRAHHERAARGGGGAVTSGGRARPRRSRRAARRRRSRYVSVSSARPEAPPLWRRPCPPRRKSRGALGAGASGRR